MGQTSQEWHEVKEDPAVLNKYAAKAETAATSKKLKEAWTEKERDAHAVSIQKKMQKLVEKLYEGGSECLVVIVTNGHSKAAGTTKAALKTQGCHRVVMSTNFVLYYIL